MIPELINEPIWNFIKDNNDLLKSNTFSRLYDRALDRLKPRNIGKMTYWFYSIGIDPVRLEKDLGIPDYYLYGAPIETFEIPNSVGCIGECAFAFCEKLKTVTIPESVNRIEAYAFHKCDLLTEIILPDSVTISGSFIFSDSGVSKVTLSDNMKSILPGTFKNCRYLNYIRIPASVNHISANAFVGCPDDLIVEYDKNNTKLAAQLQGYGVQHRGI